MIDVQHADFVVIPVTDAARAREFYGQTLGLRQTGGPHETWQEFETGNLTLGVFSPEAVGRPFEANPSPVALRVPDVAESRARLEEAGVQFEGDIIDSGVCHMAFFRDPDGNALMLHHRYAPPKGEADG
jgi:predicted enzyme related to lactoylglutathione lyase